MIASLAVLRLSLGRATAVVVLLALGAVSCGDGGSDTESGSTSAPSVTGSIHPLLLEGDDGVMFAAQTFNLPCVDDWPAAEDVAGDVDDLATVLDSRDVDLVTMVVPEKGWMYPELVPETVSGECADEAVQELRAALAPAAHHYDLWADVERAVADHPDELLYWKADTHWNDIGRAEVMPGIVDQIERGVYDTSAVRSNGAYDKVGGDLAAMAELDRTERAEDLVVERPGQHTTVEKLGTDAQVSRHRNTGPRPLIEGTTLIATDSHLFNATDWLAPWFEDVVIVRWHKLEGVPVRKLALEADRVVLSFSGRFAGPRLQRAAEDLTAALSTPPEVG
ncbi:MAG: hypothetical protein OES57_12845 [Acidimicrobiia bacterium]|nr:hypothetical protein [Acidimicrobiia bacterium]